MFHEGINDKFTYDVRLRGEVGVYFEKARSSGRTKVKELLIGWIVSERGFSG